MDDILFIALKLMCAVAALAIVVMVVNRLRGKDEIDGLLGPKKIKKDKK